jgi:hypothetical protein
MRYFYRDPLEAAYMAKHHGMQFIDLENVFEHIGDFIHTIVEHDGPFLVHPDSLHLLEPCPGDLIDSREGFDDDVGPWINLAWTPPATTIVLRRNGKLFFWPECEAA